MQYSYIARQPILDRQKSLVGYELLFRDGSSNQFPDIDSEKATSRLVSDHLLSVHCRVAHTHLIFVNFPYQSLINLVPTLLPKEQLVIEILEDCLPTKALLEAIRQMVEMGYQIALDDFVPSDDWLPFLPFVSYIKFDIRTVSIQNAKIFMEKHKSSHIQFLAEKVETLEEFEQACNASFTLFQGYFFSKPEIVTHTKLTSSFLTIIQLCKEISHEVVNYDIVESLISRDVSLSYKLLALVNSSSQIQTKIQSFKQAIIYLGEQKLKKFISLLAIASTNEDKPHYLYNLSLQTAKFCEQMAIAAKVNIKPETAFLTGMFSYLDSILEQPLTTLLKSIPVEQVVKDALILESGQLGILLKLAKAYENADWEQVNQRAQELKLTANDISLCYSESIEWTSELLEAHF